MTTLTANPYVDSKRLLNDIYGSLENKLRYSQMLIVALSFVIIAVVGALMYVSTRSHIVPYVVALRGNELVTVNELKSNDFNSIQPKLAMNLSEVFIKQVRSRSLDALVNNDYQAKAYAVTSGSTTAVIKSHFEEQAKENLLARIQINAILMKANKTIELRWRETLYEKSSGVIQAVKNYSADLTYEYSAVSLDPVVSSHNPLGFYITSCAWSEDLTTVRE